MTTVRRLLPKPSVRLRLTLWYASIFLVAGTLMLGVAYVIVSRSLTAYYRQTEAETVRGIERLERSGRLPPTESLSVPVPEEGPERERRALEERVHAQAEARAKADQRRRVAVQFSLALAGAVVLSLAGGWLVAGRALRPVAEITAAARRVGAGRLDERIALAGPRDELKELADTFDEMLTRLQAAFVSQRRFVANASHELRTPLSLIRAAVEVTLEDPEASSDPARLREMADGVRDGIARSERLTEGLLTLASSDRGLERREPVDLGELARSAGADLGPQLSAADLSVESRFDAAPVSGDPVLLGRMISNLIENAARYNEPAGFVQITTGQRDGWAYVQVVNSGAPVAPADADALVEPFRRAAADRASGHAGVGLGLSIVAAVARAHGGDVDLGARAAGGLDVTVSLPRGPM